MQTIEISDEIFEAARRTAAIDHIDVRTFVESLVRRHVEYIDMFQDASANMPSFELWQSYQKANSTAELTDEEMRQIRAARTPAEHDYTYEEDPEPTATSGMGS